VYRRRYESRRSSKPKLHQNQKNKIWRRTIFNMADGILTPCNVACGSKIVTVNSLSGSTLQCVTWLWDDMPLNSPKRPLYWNSTSGFDFDHITAVDMSFCTSLRSFIQIGPPSAEKNDVMPIFKMADLGHLGFYGSNNGCFEKPNYNFLNCSVFRKSHFCILASRSKMADHRHLGF